MVPSNSFVAILIKLIPSQLCSNVDEMLKVVEKLYGDLQCYTSDVRQVAVLRLMRQLAQVYDKISINKVLLCVCLCVCV